MKPNEIKKIKEVFVDSPIYVFTIGQIGTMCEKFYWLDKEVFRQRYVISAGGCTCLGHARFGDCKHLKILRGDASWIKTGIGPELAEEETARMFQILHDYGIETRPVEFEEIPEIVTVIELTAPRLADRGLVAVATRRKFAGVGDVGLIIRAEKSEK